jgi:hypothetical protein
MKLTHIMVIAGLACTSAVLADVPFDTGRLGRMKGILDACSRTNPQKASTLLLEMKTLIGDSTKAVVDEATRTEEYRQAYESIRSEIGNLSPDQVAGVCSAYLASSN